MSQHRSSNHKPGASQSKPSVQSNWVCICFMTDCCGRELGWYKELTAELVTGQCIRLVPGFSCWCGTLSSTKGPGQECVIAAWPTCFWNLQQAPSPQWIWMWKKNPTILWTPSLKVWVWEVRNADIRALPSPALLKSRSIRETGMSVCDSCPRVPQ